MLQALVIRDERFVFQNQEKARMFAEMFFETNKQVYCEVKHSAAVFALAECLKHALSKTYVHVDDFYGTDEDVVQKLHPHLAHDPDLLRWWNRATGKTVVREDPRAEGVFKMVKKSRAVDPLFLTMDRSDAFRKLFRNGKKRLNTRVNPKHCGLPSRIETAMIQQHSSSSL